MIETLSANRSDYAFGVWILERRSRCRDHLFDLHSFHSEAKFFSVDLISISEQVAWRRIFRKCFNDLLRSPDGRRMRSDIEEDNPSSIMEQDYEAVQGTK